MSVFRNTIRWVREIGNLIKLIKRIYDATKGSGDKFTRDNIPNKNLTKRI